MSFKKILLILICFIYYNSSFALEKNDTLSDTSLADIVEMFAFGKPKKSPFLKLPEILGNGIIINFNSYNVSDLRQVLHGNIKSTPVKITGHLAFPPDDGTSFDKVPVLVILHDSGGPGELLDNWMKWFRDIQRPLLENGIGVFYIDSFSGRGVKYTYKEKYTHEDLYKVSMVSQAIDAIMAYTFLKDHPRVDANKIGITGTSRGGTIPFIIADKKFTKHFLKDDDNGFAALLSMSPASECRIVGLFEKPEMTKNSKMLVVQGELDETSSCQEYVEKIKANGGDIEIDIKEGWYHNFVGYGSTFIDWKYNFNNCPPYYVKNDGEINDEIMDFFAKRRAWKTKADYYDDLYKKPIKTFNKMIKNFRKSDCAVKIGVHFGGKHGKEFTPQFLDFFIKNLL